MKVSKQHLPMVQFIMLYKVFLTFDPEFTWLRHVSFEQPDYM